MFVKPKLLIGSLIIGLGLSSCALKKQTIFSTKDDNSVILNVTCYNTIEIDSLLFEEKKPFEIDYTEYMEIEEYNTPTCYMPPMPKEPEFPGGVDSMYQYIAKNLKYPNSALEQNIEGVVLCEFIIEKDGSVSNVKIIKSLHPLCDEEAMRVIKLMPKWINKGEKRVYYQVPVQFKLND